MSRKIVVFGATGATGQQVVRQAVERGFEVVAFVRDPDRLETRDPASSRRQGAPEAAIRESGLDWTVVRPPRIMNRPGVRDDLVTWKGSQPSKVSWQTNTGSIAKLLLDAPEEKNGSEKR